MRVALVSGAHGNALGLGAALHGGFDAWASYATVEAASVEFHRVPFALDELDRVTRAAGMPLAGEILDRYRRS